MKVLLLCVVCAVVGGVAGGAVAWPGAAVALSSPVLKTVIPAQTKAFGFSTTQYINSLPFSYSPYVHPQFTYQVPHFNGFSGIQPGFLPAPGHTYYPASIFYPPTPIVPALPPSQSQPAPPPSPQQPSEQPGGDADTAVVDSADFSPQSPPNPTDGASQSSTPSSPPPANAFPSFPNFSQGSQGAEQPQYPQIPQESAQPSFPQIPQLPSQIPFPQIPQFPQGSVPGFPQFPQIPQIPMFPQSPSPSPPSSYPGDANSDRGLNDEDTISVESA